MASTLAPSATLLAAAPCSSRRAAGRRTFTAAVAKPLQQRRQRSSAIVRAAQDPERTSSGDIVQEIMRKMARYDFVSAGMGALAVTGFCVYRGQDPATALWITAAATIVALVVEDMLPRNSQ